MESLDSLKSGGLVSHTMRLVIMFLLVFANTQCGNGDNKSSRADMQPEGNGDEYHADNDIAMTVLSLADALRVGEPLDSAQYDFEGVLTDGQGSPLYTDVQGSPGIWQIDVTSPNRVVIRNLYLGDLLPDDLESYLTGSLGITEKDCIPYNDPSVINDDDTDVRIYKFRGGYLKFEVRAGISPNGLEGPLLNIVLTSYPPEGA